ncbi:hypothetical protein TrST_g10239 [Triparma strigata]|uniref:NADH-cytochrome b5 reductase n=1 Tax=Triparma strigata TaxID=1606541 RepID=A0A9W6ZT11_9STRA|nr:hypothetical protein TrST_g10239 [Triparma strigata]
MSGLVAIASKTDVIRCPICYQLNVPGLAKKHPACAIYHKPAGGTQSPAPAPAPSAAAAEEFASSCSLSTSWTPVELIRVTRYNHDTSIFTFGRSLMLPTCACLLLRAPNSEHGGGDAVRPYTPIAEREGEFDLLIKSYKQWGVAGQRNYRPPGAVSSYLFSLQAGTKVDFKHIKFNLKIPYNINHEGFGFDGVKTITMVAVGVGIAPMIQALNEIFDGGREDKTKVVLLLGNRSVKDILLREKLDAWERTPNFKVIHHVGTRYAGVVSHKNTCPKSCRAPCKFWVPPVPERWSELAEKRKERTWINESTIKKHAFPPSNDTRVFVCGLPSVYESICGQRGTPLAMESALGRLGYDDSQVVKF